jgi:Tfp pilus assembly protein FimT
VLIGPAGRFTPPRASQLASESMTVFDLLFLVVALVSIVSLLAAAAMAAFGRRSKALRLAGRLAVFLAVYLGVSVTVAFLTPQRVRPVENP